MSFNDVYEFIQGEYQQVTRIRQEPVSTADPVFFKDLNLVKWAGFSIEIWSAETGGTQLVQGLDYELQYLDVAASGPAGEPVYSGFSILTPLYYNIPLYQTANIVGAYTTRPYRPSYNVITADTTVTPASMDDSVIADATGGSFTVTIADGFHLNQRYSIICKGLGTVTVVGTGISSASFTGVGVSWLWDGGEWMPLAAPGAREGGFYYDYVPAFIRPDTDPISATIPDFLATYGEGFFYVGLEFTYQGTTDKTNGTFAIADDGIDKYAVLAVDVAGGDSTLSIQWQWATDTMVAIETGNDFTDLNLWAVYRWEKVTYGGYGAWANTAEAPPYGEAITSGQELYLDGTKEFVSSDGNAPVVDVVDYLPASRQTLDIDGGSQYAPENSKWPGQRGTYGFFGDYDNEWLDGVFSIIRSTTAREGSFQKVTCNDPGTFYVRKSYPTGSITNGFVRSLFRRGSTNTSRLRIFDDGVTTGLAGIIVDYDARTFTAQGPIVDKSYFVDETIAVIAFTFTGLAGASNILTYPGGSDAGVVGDFGYYENPLYTSLPYEVPYVAGTHQPAKLQYNKDWAESAEWTIQGWFNPPDLGGTTEDRYIYDNRVVGSNINGFWIYKDTQGIGWALATNDGSLTELPITGIIEGQYNYIKVAFVSLTSISVYINGGPAQPITTNIPSASNLTKWFALGSNRNFAFPFRGYIQDFTIQPGINTDDAHYLSGLPYYNPNKTVGKNASWSIDARGNISGNNQVAGVIIQDEMINNQWVTRWDTGHMTITGIEDSAAVNPVSVAISHNFADTNYSAVGSVAVATARTIAFSNFTTSSFDISRYTSDGTGATTSSRWVLTGRWK